MEKGGQLSYLNAHEYKLWTMNDLAVDISRDGLRGLSSSVDGTMVLWDLADLRKLQRLTGHADTVGDLAMGRLGPFLLKGAVSSPIRRPVPDTGGYHQAAGSFSGHDGSPGGVTRGWILPRLSMLGKMRSCALVMSWPGDRG